MTTNDIKRELELLENAELNRKSMLRNIREAGQIGGRWGIIAARLQQQTGTMIEDAVQVVQDELREAEEGKK